MISQYIIQPSAFPFSEEMPWAIIGKLSEILYGLIDLLDDGYEIKDGVAIHNTAVIGHDVNIEAGAILTNHYNEREDDTVYVYHYEKRICTHLTKFGSLVGDGCRIGANTVLSPGTLLKPKTIIRRLQLVEQDPQ